ncbi:MAG TPA: 2OG-Fe(II) oxygenase family protein [Candidatus Paceibacterota bacterium]|nr:2OG-Fe(II) oxygenase family protein [Candidatus Paceibacterota bacterium]
MEELERNGCLYVDYDPSLRKGVEEAVAAWKAFCALPEEKKMAFEYDGDMNVSGNGYELKKGEQGQDFKENVHLRVAARDELLASAAEAHPVIGPEFVETALALNPLMAPLLRSFAVEVEGELGMEGFEADVMERQSSWLLRFLHYFGGRKPGEVLAAPHGDKGGFTLHLYESHAGVERLTFDTEEWVPMDLPHGKTVIFPGMGLQNRAKCRLRAPYHRVVATEETADTGRWSAVCFFNFRNGRHFNKRQHGSQQSQPLAFNYHMQFDQFDDLFVDG